MGGKTDAMQRKPLTGLRVLDLTRLLPGPMCTLHLADMGAEVIKIEDPRVGDYVRWTPPLVRTHSPLFLAINRNKKSVKLDLTTARGKELFLQLAGSAHVVLEGFRPGVVQELGIDYEAVRAVNPAIVYGSLTGYGQTGPYRDRAGHDINYCGYVGVADQIGEAGAAPALPNFQIADLAGGALSAAMGLLAAVTEQQMTGQGRYLDVAMTDCTLAHEVVALSTLVAYGTTRPRGQDLLTGGLPCYGYYETRDGRYMAVGALESKFWARLCSELGRSDLADKGLATGAEGEAVRSEIAAVFKQETQAHWTAKLAAADCCVAPVLDLAESMEDDQVQARDLVVEVDHPDDGTLVQFAFPIKFSDFTFEVERPAPRHGEHTEEVLGEAGVGKAELAELRRTGVI